MTKGYDAWDVLNVLVNRVKVHPDYKPDYETVRRLLCSVSDIEWEYILDVIRPVKHEVELLGHPEGCQCEAHQDHSWIK